MSPLLGWAALLLPSASDAINSGLATKEEQAALRPAIKPVLLAGGEHEFTHYGFAELARAGALDIWQPDLAWCGGMTAARRIVAQAARSGVQVVPHRGGEVWRRGGKRGAAPGGG